MRYRATGEVAPGRGWPKLARDGARPHERVAAGQQTIVIGR